MTNLPPFNLPPDVTNTELKILDYSYAHIYRMVDDPLDKFIVAFMFDLGHSTNVTAVAAGVSRKTIWERHKRIKNTLKGI